jgi:surface protein
LKSSFFLLILDVFLVNDHLVKKSSVRLNPGRQFFRALTVVYLVFGAAQHVAAQTSFVTTWRVVDNSAPFVLPIQNHTPGNTYTIDWGDGSTDNTVYTTADTPQHDYTDAETYVISYSGNFTHLEFINRLDLLGVVNWGSTQWTSMNSMFRGCENFNELPDEAPDLTSTEDLSGMFRNATSFNRDISDWDVSNVTDMSLMFKEASSFNQDISSWDLSNVTNMSEMFMQAREFNSAIGGWNVSSVTDMSGMFDEADDFNQDLNLWNVANVTTMEKMFRSADSFNGNIGSWVLSSLTNMESMFIGAVRFNQDLNDWNVSKVTSMRQVFRGASAFNGDISTWDVSSVTSMMFMFLGADLFNQDISSWDVSGVKNMQGMFFRAGSFDQDLGSWDIRAVTDMEDMFGGASAFNGDISTWDVRSVTSMMSMFLEADLFNQDISSWDVSSVTNMAGMFSSAGSFDQDLGSWDIRAVTDMEDMFDGVTLSKANYDATITGWVTTAISNGITLNENVPFSGGNSTYCACEPERNDLINDLGWIITDGGKDCNDNDLITSYTLTTDGPICEGENATITMSGSQVDVQYQLRRDSDDFNVGEPIDGTGSELDFEITKPPVSANYHVLATNDETEAEIDNRVEITVNNRPSVILTYGAPTTQPDFNQQSPSISNSAMAAYAVFAADLDNDGDMDVLSASAGDNKIAWYENEGLGRFGAEQIISENANGANSVFAVDMDGDGNMDVLSALGNDHTIAWYKNTGGGATFTEQIIATNVQWASSVYAGDLDGDGHVDVLSVGLFSGVSWRKNMDGEGTSWSASTINSVGTPVAVSAADLDGDGDLDVLSTSFDTDKIDWYENKDGAGTFEDAQNITDAAPGTRSVFAVDIDGDGDMDVLSGSENGSKVAWHENADGMGTSWAEKDISTEAAPVASVYAADLDRDGDIDVLSASYDDDKIAWYENIDSEGTFGVERIISTAADGANSVFAADLDGDGDIDVMSASRNDNMIAWYQNSLLVPQCEGDVQFNAISNATTPTWTWTTNGSAKINDNTSPNPIVKELVNGEKVTVNVDDENGCANSATAKVAIIGVPTIAATGTDPTTCGGTNGSIEITGLDINTTYEISYTDDGTDVTANMTSNGEGSILVTDLNQGTYNNITATLSGCTSNAAGPVTLSDPTIAATGTDPTTCRGTNGSIEITGLDINTTYEISYTHDGTDVTANMTSNGEGSILVTDLNQGTYNNITATLSGCTSNAAGPVTLSDPAIPGIAAVGTDPLACGGSGSIDFTFTNVPNGNYTISYDGGSFPAVFVSANAASVNATAGAYNNLSITVSGCLSSDDPSVSLSDPGTPLISLGTVSDPSTCAAADGAIQITGLIANTDYEIDYTDDGSVVSVNLTSDASGFISIASLDSGTYTDITASLAGCESNSVGPVTLSDPAIPGIAAVGTDPSTCGGTDGSFEITGLDINTTYEISYTDDGTNVTANMTSNGEGSILVTDLNQGTYNNITATLSGCTSNAAGPVTLSDPGGECINEDFVTIWQVDDITTPFRLPKQGFLPEGKSYTIDWGDGTSDANTYTNVDVPTHSYSTSGAHQITYSGDFTQLRFEDRDDLLGVANWGNTQWTSMNSMFKGCSKFNNIPSTAPDLTFTNDLSNMLQGASSFNQSMANWDVSSITDMSALFYEAASFQGDISGWRVSNVTNMRAMFFRASAFDGDLSQWDVSQVEEMSYMFYNASAFAGDISSWNVSRVTDMSFMFYGAVRFNGDLGNWNVANVTSMRAMFSSATNFPGGINNWNVSNVTDMRAMFSNAQAMSGSLDKWEVSSVTNMVAMFADALSFDGDIGSWDVASVVDMRNMFSGAEQFSSDISGWNVSAVSDMSYMFNGAIAFNADISDWNVFNVLDMTGMFNEASAFNRNLSGWCVGQINKEPTGFDAGTTAWTNPDWRPKWGVSCIPEGAFLSTWEVSEADLSVTVPVVPAVAYNYFVDWGDGYTSSRQTGNAVHTYSEAGTYTISIAGTFPRIYFNNRGDRNKIRFIDQWGDQRWSSMENAFAGCSKLQIAAVDAPNLKFVRNLRGMFKGATSLNSGLGHWDVSSATNMSDMFANTASFNGDVSEWNVGLVRDFSGMFRQATAFDQDLGNWDITNATKMDDMFEGVTLSTEHYDALLIGWAGLDAPPEGITFHGGSSTYCAGDDARKTLQLRHRWRITDGNRSTACILGIEGSLLSQAMLYPNPTQGIVHLQGWEEGKVRTVVIFDLSGRIVIKMDPSNQLNLEHLLEGTYILRLEGDQGLKTFKLIRN